MREEITVIGAAFFVLLLVGLMGYFYFTDITPPEPITPPTPPPLPIIVEEKPDAVFYCCNLEGIWKDRSCWAHLESWCTARGQKPDGRSCNTLCEDEGYEKGYMLGLYEGQTASSPHCECYND